MEQLTVGGMPADGEELGATLPCVLGGGRCEGPDEEPGPFSQQRT